MKKYISILLIVCMFGMLVTPTVAADEIIIDNTDSGFTTVDGNPGDWRTSGGVTGYNNSNTMYCNQEGSEAIWAPELEKGTYLVSIYKVFHPQYSCVQSYEIFHNGKKDYIQIDFTAGESGFVEIGELTFAGTGDEYIKLVKLKTSGTAASRADAVKFVRVSSDLKEDSIKKEYASTPFVFGVVPPTLSHPIAADPEGTVVKKPDQAKQEGGWKSSGLKDFDGGGTIYADDDTTAEIRWDLTQKGYYKLSVYKVAHGSSSIQQYEVAAGEDKTSVFVDFGKEPAEWVDTDTFYFDGNKNYISLRLRMQNKQTLRVGSIKLIPSTKEAYEEDKTERETIKVEIDGERIEFDQQPVLINSRTMVPLRKIFETLGAHIQWNEATETVTAVKGDTTISLTINNDKASVNNEIVELDSSATLVNGRTMVPVRFISEAMGAQVSWIDYTKTVVVSSTEMLAKNMVIFPYDMDDLGTWKIETQDGAYNGTILKGVGKEEIEKNSDFETINAKKLFDVPVAGKYRVWVRARDYASNQPGTRFFDVAINGKQLEKTFGKHGQEGYTWEDAGFVDLTNESGNVLEFIDTSMFYSRCTAIFITGNMDLTPPDEYERLMALVPGRKGSFDRSFPVYAKENGVIKDSFSIEGNGSQTVFYTVETSKGDVIKKETKLDGKTVTGIEQTLGYILMYANKSEVVSMAYQYPLWKQTYTYQDKEFIQLTQNIYETGIPYWLIPTRAEKISDTQAKLYYSSEKADMEALWTYDESFRDPKVSVTIKAKVEGSFSVGLASGIETPLDETDYFVNPMIFVGKKLPENALLTYERFCPAPLSVKTIKNASGETVTVGVTVDGESITDKWYKENWNEDTYATGITGAQGGVMPAIFAPVMGTDRAHLLAGSEISISYRQVEQFGEWYDLYTKIITDLYHFSDYRENYMTSLNDAIFNTTRLALDDYAAGWNDDMKGHYNREIVNTVTHSNPLIYLERYLLTEDKTLLEKRTVPTIEFLLTRGRVHFANGKNSAGSYSVIGKPVGGYSTSVFGGAYEMTRGSTDSLKEIGLDKGTLYVNGYGQIPKFVEQLWYYNYTKDENALAEAKAGADRWIEQMIDMPQTILPNSETFILVSFFPYFQGVLDLYETTKEQKYLDAAVKAGRLIITTLWAGPNADPDKEITVSADAFREDHFRKGIIAGGADAYNYEKIRFGYPEKLEELKDQKLPFWVVSRAGLGMEQNFTYVMHRNSNITMSNWAPDIIRLAKYSNDPVLEAFARSGVIGRHTNYSGYYYNQYSTYHMDPDYPYVGPDVTGLYYHHIPPFLAMLEDFLISQAWAWSDEQIDFPYVRNHGYAYFTNRQYGFEDGNFFDESDMWLWIKEGLVTTDNIQADWVAVRKDGKGGVAFMNESEREITIRATLGADFGDINTTAKVFLGSTDSVEIADNKLTLTIPARSLVAITFDAQVNKPAFADMGITLGSGNQTKANDQKVTGTVIQLSPDEYFAYVYTTSTPNEISKASIKYRIGDGTWITETKETYPFEFTIKVDDPNDSIRFTVIEVSNAGTQTITKEMVLKAK